MDGQALRRSVCEVLGPGAEVTIVIGRQGQVDVRLTAAQWQRIRDALETVASLQKAVADLLRDDDDL